MQESLDWTQILVVTIPAAFVLLGVIVQQSGKRAEQQRDREQSLEARVGNLENKVSELSEGLRKEQVFSHKLVLKLTQVVYYLREQVAYIARWGDSLPGVPPRIPDVDELEALLDERPTYRPRDQP